jgi:hypothetical protein
MSKNLIYLLLLACGLWQCTEVTELGNDIGREYYPVKVGNYWIYDVSETTFTNQFLTDPADSVTYQVRERVDTVFRNQVGELTYKVIRSKRTRPGQPWGQDSLVTIIKSSSDVRYTYDNLKTVKLVFPVVEHKQWDGNAFNVLQPDNSQGLEKFKFTYAQVGQPFALPDTSYQHTVKVIQFLRQDAIKLVGRQEVYALGVGMIHKRIIDYHYEICKTEKCEEVRPGFIVHGRRIIQKLSTFGPL